RRVGDGFDLVRDLLDLAAAQRPIDEETGESVALGRTLEKAVEVARERARGKGIGFEGRLPGPDVTVHGQPGDIERIVTNLLDNAIKYTPPGGQVRFSVSADDSTVRVEVADTGIGIDPSEQPRVFEGFYRTAAAKASSEVGTGLGLSIVQRLLDRWNGKLELESSPGQGSRFVITFPR
ncbi:MAG: HAMP domain-containing sensor histidine kinase, partial [Acidobacteriota bacterium]